MDHETEVIKQQMLETRSSLTEKLEALEEQVASTVRSTQEAVTGTAEAVKEAVENTVSKVSDTVQGTVDSVKETFDFRRQMEAHPWLMVGGALAAGYVAGALLSSGAAAAMSSSLSSNFTAPSTGDGRRGGGEQWASGLWDRMFDAVQPVVSRLEGLAIGTAAGVVGDMLLNSAPEKLRAELKPIFDQFTTSLGGKPMHGLWEGEQQQRKPESNRS
jgi:ElaB/YqjD/DUF883 family membrane-anchored ribosome-binding protein